MKLSTNWAITAESLRTYKKINGLTNEMIGEACALSASMVSRYLNAESVPTVDLAQSIMRAMGIEDETEHASIEQGPSYEGSASDQRELIHHIESLLGDRIADLKAENEELRRQIRLERLERQRTLIIAVLIALALAVWVLIDVSNGAIGWIRY